MEIQHIFELVEESLYSVCFEGEPIHEFSRLFGLWNNVEYLESFFEEHRQDLA